MPKRKVLKSVARSVADSFTSLMNYFEDDYVLSHIVAAGRDSGESNLHVDLISGEARPEELLTSQVRRSIDFYHHDFPKLVKRSGADMGFIVSAELKLEFDLSTSRPSPPAPRINESHYVCTCTIVDDRGRRHSAELRGWW